MSIYMFKITVDKDMIVGADKPWLMLLIDSRISTLPSGFWDNVADPNGLDIRFYADQGKVVEYDEREVVRFNVAPNEFEAWIRINISSTVDTVIYCEVGGGNLVKDPNTWLGHQRVYHMQNNLDSHTSDPLIITEATLQPGKIQKCYEFDGVNDKAKITSNPDIPGVEAEIYVSAWVYIRSLRFGAGYTSNISSIITKGQYCQTSTRGWLSFGFGIDESAKLIFHIAEALGGCNGTTVNDRYTTDMLLSLNTWYHVGVYIPNIIVDSPNRLVYLYVNGQEWANTEDIIPWPAPVDFDDSVGGREMHIGAAYRPGIGFFQNFDGFIDEVRVVDDADVYADGTWQETEYNNQNDPDLFIVASELIGDPIPFNIIYRLKRAGNLDKPTSSLFSWLVGSGGHFDAPAAESGIITDHIARAQALLIEQFENSADLKTLLGIYVAQLQEIEYVISNLGLTRNINAATGAQLDIIGERVGESRQFRNDDDYRTAIRSRIFLNSSNGEPETVIEAIRVLTNSNRVWYSEVQPATIFLDYQGDFLPPGNLQQQIEQIALAGVQIFIAYINNNGPVFGFDGEGPLPPSENASGFSEEGYAPGGVELGGQFMELIT